MGFPALEHPIVGAPLAGGPSRPELAAAVSSAGGLGFLAAGYLDPGTVADQIARVRTLTDAPYGLNIFCLEEGAVDTDALTRYADRVAPHARAHGAEPGTPRFEDDGFAAKVELAVRERPDVVSFTFGCPAADVIAGLQDAGVAVWVTVTDVAEAVIADVRGADAVVVQGDEAGGHRGSFHDVDGVGELGLLPLLRLTARATGYRSSRPVASPTAPASRPCSPAERSRHKWGRLHALPGGGNECATSRGARPPGSHQDHAGLYRPARARDRRPVHG